MAPLPVGQDAINQKIKDVEEARGKLQKEIDAIKEKEKGRLNLTAASENKMKQLSLELDKLLLQESFLDLALIDPNLAEKYVDYLTPAQPKVSSAKQQPEEDQFGDIPKQRIKEISEKVAAMKAGTEKAPQQAQGVVSQQPKLKPFLNLAWALLSIFVYLITFKPIRNLISATFFAPKSPSSTERPPVSEKKGDSSPKSRG